MPGRRAAVVHDGVRPRQPDRRVPGGSVPPGARRRRPSRPSPRCRRRSGTTGATPSPARSSTSSGAASSPRWGDPAHALLRHARRDAALADPARRVRALDRRHRARARSWSRTRAPRSPGWTGRRPRRRRLRRVPKRSSQTALDNQCWRDSHDSIALRRRHAARAADRDLRAPGLRLRRAPATARLAARGLGRRRRSADGSKRDAAALKERFNRDFWLAERGYFALALDGDEAAGRLADLERRAPALERHRRRASAPPTVAAAAATRHVLRLGHPLDVLDRGGVQPARVPQRHRLAARHGADRAGHAPVRVRGRGGRVCERAARRGRGVLEPAPGGVRGLRARRNAHAGRVPGALKPQSWAAAAPLLALRTLLGLDVVDTKLRVDPIVAPGIGPLRLRGLCFRGGRVDVP